MTLAAEQSYYVGVNTTRLVPIALVVAAACGGNSPAAPDDATAAIVATGAQVFRMSLQSPCAQASKDFFPIFVYTRVNVARSGNEWMATASGAAAGDLEISFHQTSPRIVMNSFQIAGSIKGTAIHMPELFQAPAWDGRADFGTDGRTALTGVAFAAGFAGAQTGGLDGLGTGSVVLTDTAGHACNGTSFSWSILPPQTP
jgi:hypothetical protein